MNIYARPAFRRAMKRLDSDTQEKVRGRARSLPALIGQPHLHGGSGVRSFGRYKEFRVGLDLRCLFLLESGDIHLITVGNHDEVRAYVKNNG